MKKLIFDFVMGLGTAIVGPAYGQEPGGQDPFYNPGSQPPGFDPSDPGPGINSTGAGEIVGRWHDGRVTLDFSPDGRIKLPWKTVTYQYKPTGNPLMFRLYVTEPNGQNTGLWRIIWKDPDHFDQIGPQGNLVHFSRLQTVQVNPPGIQLD